MAKPLRDPPPSSSIARLFEMSAAARAVAAPIPSAERPEPIADEPTQSPARQPRRSGAEHPTLKRELVLTPSADRVFGELVDLYRQQTQSRLTASHVARAMMKAIAHCFDQLEREAKRIGPLKLPQNARGKEDERERFESRLADAFVAGIRGARAFGSDDG